MRKKFYSFANKSGVYQITNTKNGKVYIGSAKSFKKRANQHQNQLRNNKHQNKHLQASFNKHGEDAFEFHVIDVVDGDKNERFLVEQDYLDEVVENHDWEDCFNFKQEAEQKERGSFSKNPEETREKLSKAQKRLWQDPEERRKRIEGQDGKRRENIGKASKNMWASKTQEERKAFRKLRSDITKQQWQDPETRKRRIDGLKKAEGWDALRKKLVVIAPTGERVEVVGIKPFCEKHGLDRRTFQRMLQGKHKHHKGWTRA